MILVVAQSRGGFTFEIDMDMVALFLVDAVKVKNAIFGDFTDLELAMDENRVVAPKLHEPSIKVQDGIGILVLQNVFTPINRLTSVVA